MTVKATPEQQADRERDYRKHEFPTRRQVREHYERQGYQVRISGNGRVEYLKNNIWREGRWMNEYRIFEGQIIHT